MLEAGSVRSKNTTNILVKNFGDLCLGVVAFCLVGYGLAFSEGNEWAGNEYFGLINLPYSLLPHVFMQVSIDILRDSMGSSLRIPQAAFAATCMTIVSGATAERMDYAGYLITRWPIAPILDVKRSWKYYFLCLSSVVVTGLVYPVGTHWAWTSLGWLATE